ncbi:hypothetical protein CN918_26800 [Priestia megaterium]|nr:hypothetical protein CN918_26800 [Priestia megaterium]
MNLNILLRDSILHALINLGIFGLLMHYEFELTSRDFTLLLALNLYLVCILTGVSSRRVGGSPEINGWMVGVISFSIISIILATYVNLDLEVSAIVFAIWSLVGFLGGLTGGFIGKPLKRSI